METNNNSQKIYSDRILIKSRRFYSLYLFLLLCLFTSFLFGIYEIYNIYFINNESSATFDSVDLLKLNFLFFFISALIFNEFRKNNFRQLKFHKSCFTLKKEKKDININYEDITQIKLGKIYFTISTKSKTIKLSPYNIERSEYILQEIQKIYPDKFWDHDTYKKYIDRLILLDHGTKYGNFLNFASVISDSKFGAIQLVLIFIPLVIFKIQEIEYNLSGDNWLVNSLFMFLLLFVFIQFIFPWILLIFYKMSLKTKDGKIDKVYRAGKARIFALTRFALSSFFIIFFIFACYFYGFNLQEKREITYLWDQKPQLAKVTIDYRYSCFKCFNALRINDFVYVNHINEDQFGLIKSTPDKTGHFKILSLRDFQDYSVPLETVKGKIIFDNLKVQKDILSTPNQLN